jgi:hypothetical protein
MRERILPSTAQKELLELCAMSRCATFRRASVRRFSESARMAFRSQERNTSERNFNPFTREERMISYASRTYGSNSASTSSPLSPISP